MRVFILLTLALLMGCNSSNKTKDLSFDENYYGFPKRDSNSLGLYFQNMTIKYINLSEKKEYVKSELLDSALLYVDSLLCLEPNTDYNYFLKYRVYLNKKNMDSAKNILFELIEIYNQPTAYFYLGVLYEEEGNMNQALQKYIQADNWYNHYDSVHRGLYIDRITRQEAYVYLYGKKEVLRETRKEFLRLPFDFDLRIRRSFSKGFYRDLPLNDTVLYYPK